MRQAKEIMYKVVFVGEEKSGKKSVRDSLTKQAFQEKYVPNDSVDFSVLEKEEPPSKIHLQIWNIAGNQKTSSMLRTYFRESSIFAIFIDSTQDLETQKRLITQWRNIIEPKMSGPARYIVVLTKSDLGAQTSPDEINKWIETTKGDDRLVYAGCCITSAKNNQTNVLNDLLFETAKSRQSFIKKWSMEQNKSEILTTIKSKQFPEEYTKLIADQDTLQEKVIALFEDYRKPGFHWHSQKNEAKDLITKLKNIHSDDPEELLQTLISKYNEMYYKPDFNLKGTFAERLFYGIKLIDEFQQTASHRLGK